MDDSENSMVQLIDVEVDYDYATDEYDHHNEQFMGQGGTQVDDQQGELCQSDGATESGSYLSAENAAAASFLSASSLRRIGNRLAGGGTKPINGMLASHQSSLASQRAANSLSYNRGPTSSTSSQTSNYF